MAPDLSNFEYGTPLSASTDADSDTTATAVAEAARQAAGTAADAVEDPATVAQDVHESSAAVTAINDPVNEEILSHLRPSAAADPETAARG